MEEQVFRSTPKTQDSLYSQALQIYKDGEHKELEKLFNKFLKKSYDLRLWNLYIDYVNKVSTKKVRLTDVYGYVSNHFECSYFSYDYVYNYIKELSNSVDSSDGNFGSQEIITLIRKTYHRFMIPMHNLGLLWSEYEKWEMKINKSTAKSFIDQIQPIYNLSFNTYQRLLPYIESNQYFRIFDIELENPLKLSNESRTARLNFLFNFYINKYSTSSPLLFIYSFYLKDLAKDKIDITGYMSPFLSVWYSFLYNKEFFDFNDTKNKDLILINYFNWILKNEGIETFRKKLSEHRNTMGPYVYIYAARSEFYQGSNIEGAYQIFSDAVERFKTNVFDNANSVASLINEQYFKIFLNIGDDDKIRRLFKKLLKTEVMWDLMIEYEFLHGEMEDYKNLLIQRQMDKEILPSVSMKPIKVKRQGTQGVYEQTLKSFGFLDLRFKVQNKITTHDGLEEFIRRLPELSWAENVLSNFSSDKLIELLTGLKKA